MSSSTNQFSNLTYLYSRTEPILSLPGRGTCTLLTGFERDNITSTTFQPCCSDAVPLGLESSRCVCKDDCESCIALNQRNFRLITAVCNTSAARPKKVPTMVAVLLVLGTLALQASASTLVRQRSEDASSYNGPGKLLGDLRPSGSITARAVSYDEASDLLGANSVVDCLPNGFTDLDEAKDASTSFMNGMAGSDMSLRAEGCRLAQAGSTHAEICNLSDETMDIAPDVAQAGLDVLVDHCISRGSSGTIRSPDGSLTFRLYPRIGSGRQDVRRRESGKLAKRCVDTNTQAVTACEDVVCEPKIAMNPSGDCPNVGNDETDGCSYYCEVKAAKYYGPPTMVEDTHFCGKEGCYLETGKILTFERSISTTFGLEGGGPWESVLSGGITFGFAWSTAVSTTQGHTFEEDACGWWYQVPVMVHTCGSVSEYEPNFTGPEGGPLVCLKDAPLGKTTGNVCSEYKAKFQDSDDPDYMIVQKLTNCDTREDLPIEEQSASWQTAYGKGLDTVDVC